MSYLLETEMTERVNRFRHEADVRRAVRPRPARSRLATVLRTMADRLEPTYPTPIFRFEQGSALLHGRKD